MRKDKEPIRKAILEVTKKEPKNPTEISRDMSKISKISNPPKPHKIVQNFLNGMVERGLLFRLENSQESKDWMLKRFKKEWALGKNKKEFENYYFNTKNSGSEELKDVFNSFISKLGEFIENKDAINNQVNKVCMLLSEFEAKNNPSKAKPWMTHKHMRDGSIKHYESKQPIRRLTHKETSNFHKGLKLFLEEKSKHVKLSDDEQRTLDELNKEKGTDFEFEDKNFINIVNKINQRTSKFDGVENAHLSGTISRELNDLVNSIYSQINVPNILNKIAKGVKKPTFS